MTDMNRRERAPEPWNLIQSEKGPDLKLFRARFDLVESPRNSLRMKAVVLETPDWVNIVAITLESKVVVVRQYRFGAGKVTTEIPAGIVDSGETSGQAAARELREETGYTSSNWTYLGWVEPNAAFQNNRCHHWLALDAKKTDSLQLDESEDITVDEMSLRGIQMEIRHGRMKNALSLLALGHVFDVWSVCE